MNAPNNAPTNKYRKAQRKELILEMVKKNKEISKNFLALELDVDRKTIHRDLSELKKEGLIEFIGDKRTGVWRLKNE